MPRSPEQGPPPPDEEEIALVTPATQTEPKEPGKPKELVPVTEEEQERLRERIAAYSEGMGYRPDARDVVRSLEKTDPQAFQELQDIENRWRQELLDLEVPLFDYSVQKILDCAQPNSLGDSEKDPKMEKERRLSKLQSMLEHAVTWLHLPEEEKVSLKRRYVDLLDDLALGMAYAKETEDEKEERVNRAYIAIPRDIQYGQEKLLPKIEALEKTIEEVKGSIDRGY